jgi:glycosyltransferase involved in cell wall biosynthesis
MTILIVSPTLNHGGAERVACLWAQGFVERGYKVIFVANIEKEIVYSLGQGVQLLPLTSLKGNKIVRYLRAVKRLRGYYKKHRPDVIIGVMFVCSFLAKIAGLGMRIPVVNTEHNSFVRPKQQPMSWIDKISKFYVNYIYDAVTVLTEADYMIIKNRFKRVYALPNPTFLKPIEIVPTKQKVLLAAGRLDAWYVKGFDVLIKAFGLLIQNEELKIKDLGWRLQIAGTGSEESLRFLKQLCKENGVEDTVDFLGFKTDIEDLYRQSEIFVLSSRYEGFGMVLVEAMSQGCACVACDYKGRQREITQNNEQGICCEPDDVDALANALKKMITDEGYRRSAQENAIIRSRSFTLDKITDRWFDIFEQLTH